MSITSPAFGACSEACSASVVSSPSPQPPTTRAAAASAATTRRLTIRRAEEVGGGEILHPLPQVCARRALSPLLTGATLYPLAGARGARAGRCRRVPPRAAGLLEVAGVPLPVTREQGRGLLQIGGAVTHTRPRGMVGRIGRIGRRGGAVLRQEAGLVLAA